MYDMSFTIVFIVICAIGTTFVAKSLFDEEDDGLVEEIAEEVIEGVTGQEVDLTFWSVEEEESLKKAIDDWQNKRYK